MIAATFAALALSAGAGHCQEDQSCWSWSTMGNRHRGVTLRDGTRRVVGPCALQRLVYVSGRVSLKGQHLKGDAHALRYGCGFDVLDY